MTHTTTGRISLSRSSLDSGGAFASCGIVYRGLLAGAVGGLVGTWAMSEMQRVWTHVVDGSAPRSAGGRHDARDWQERSEHRNANELAAQTVARYTIRRTLTRQELGVAAPLVHYMFGTAMGALYGAYADRRVSASGAAFGTALWLAADEIAMPFLGLSDSARRRPIEMHLQSWAAHLVYGATAELARRSMRRQLNGRAFRTRGGAI